MFLVLGFDFNTETNFRLLKLIFIILLYFLSQIPQNSIFCFGLFLGSISILEIDLGTIVVNYISDLTLGLAFEYLD